MLRHITILSVEGITAYHRSFVANDLDDVLFSALSGAIIAFSKELGDELQSIHMKKQLIYFKTVERNIIIFSFDAEAEIDSKILERKLNKAISLETLLQICSSGINQLINKKLEGELLDIFDMSNIEEFNKKDDEMISIEELTGDAFLDALNKLDNI